MHFVYILRCRDNSYYVGMTENVTNRVALHNTGRGPIFTACRLPVELVYQESFATLEEAIRREKQLKGWSRAKKAALISGDLAMLHRLSACQQSQLGDSIPGQPPNF